MAPRVVRALLTAAALLAPLLLASHLPAVPSAAAAGTPAPAPAPHQHHRPPRRHVPPSGTGSNDTHPRRQPLRPPGHPRHPPPAPTAWWRRLNFGERVGVAIAGVAVAMQVVFVAFLLALHLRARHRRAAAAGKAEEEVPAAAASRPPPA